MVNLQNIFIHPCFYCLYIFYVWKKICSRWVHFIFTLNQFNFILSEQIFISQRSRIITFPFTHPYFSSSFPLSFQSNPPTQKKLLQLKFLKKVLLQKNTPGNCYKRISPYYSLSSWHFINIGIKSVPIWKLVLCKNFSAWMAYSKSQVFFFFNFIKAI